MAVLLSACGFRPLYGGGSTLGGGETALDKVEIGNIAGPTGQMLKNALIDRFYHNGYPDDAKYQLTVIIQETMRNIVIQKNDTTSRAQLVLRAIYTIQDKKTKQLIDRGDLRAVSSFNVLQSQYTTLVTRNQSRENTVKELADKLTMRAAVVLEGK